MKIETLKERIEKAQAKIERKSKTIDKKNFSIVDKLEEVVKLIGSLYEENGYKKISVSKLMDNGIDEETARKAYWIVCDIESLTDDVDRLHREIDETEKTIAKYEAQLSGEIERERLFSNEIPETMKQLERELVKAWDESDKYRRSVLRKIYDEVGYSAFFKGTEAKYYCDRHTYADYQHMKLTDDEIHTANEKEARFFVLDLYNRVKAVTGEVTAWDGIELRYGNNFPVLNGYVQGKEGRAEVESILAGGYNIQRLHIRTIVHAR